ncbi:MAG: heme-binding protein [Deltaproteobacteria bacterium]|nr:heme-binding protein [Deltaproteobacteria bacterium]
MKTLSTPGRFATTALCLALHLGYLAYAVTASAADAPRPLAPPTALSLHEARVIIDAAVAYAREQKLRMTVVILDDAGQLISADRMEGASFHLERFAKGKAYASLMLRDRTETAAQLAKSRPDRYFGIMNMYPGEVYLVGGGIPLAVGNRLVGAVGVAGLPQGVDDKAAEAGIAAWNKFRESMKK